MDELEQLYSAIMKKQTELGRYGEKTFKELFGQIDHIKISYSLYKEHAEHGEDTIKRIHRAVLKKDTMAGQYRDVDVHLDKNTLKIPPQPEQVPQAMQELVSRYGRLKDTIANIAAFHCEFEGIHPFNDGNGRTGRAYANLQLLGLGLPPVDFRDRSFPREYDNSFTEYEFQDSTKGMEQHIAALVLNNLEKIEERQSQKNFGI